MIGSIYAPVIALVLWSFVMWAWLYATRIPAMLASGKTYDPRGPASQLEEMIPPQVRWKADNYNHLMEQPTLFYATALTLALVGHGVGLNAWLAWAYVAIRIVHSLVQATVNHIMARFSIFMVGSVVLLILALRAAMVAFA
jgi:hypothetical protein